MNLQIQLDFLMSATASASEITTTIYLALTSV